MAEFVTVARLEDVPPGELKAVKAGNKDVCLANVDGTIYAIGNICTHAGAPLADGYLDGELLECPWHAGFFNVKTGEAIQVPVFEDVPSYEVRIEGDEIQVAVA